MRKTLRVWLEMLRDVGTNIHLFLNDHHLEKGRFAPGNTNMYYAEDLLEICGETRLAMEVINIENCVYSGLELPCLVIHI